MRESDKRGPQSTACREEVALNTDRPRGLSRPPGCSDLRERTQVAPGGSAGDNFTTSSPHPGGADGLAFEFAAVGQPGYLPQVPS